MTCEQCKFFVKIGTTGPLARLECHRYPPVPILVRGSNGQATVGSFFPSVKTDTTCGEHQTKLTAG